MGLVYLAHDPVIGRRIALKTLMIPADAEEAGEFQQRFLREAQAAGILNHPGIVTVFDAGVDEPTGLSYIAMEHVEGKSLKELMAGGQLAAYSEAARLGAALSIALHYAHERGVIHRDIKPANILITSSGGVKITDFGVARLESSSLTATGQFIGTPNYMSPEQVAGNAVDGRSDLFSLGVVLFELLTGSRPFSGSSLSEVSYKIVNENPAIPSQLRRGLPAAFNPILLKLLEKDPESRYQRGADVARALDALRRVLSGAAPEVAAPKAEEVSEAAPAIESVSMTAARTTTRATSVSTSVFGKDSIWRLPIKMPWAVATLSAIVLPLALGLGALLAKVDQGPWYAVPPGEPARRHRIVEMQRAAAEALDAGDYKAALELLEGVWDQAPHSSWARQLSRRATEMRLAEERERARFQRVKSLREEGQELLRSGQLSEASTRFREALELDPDDTLAREYLALAEERARAQRVRRARVPTPRPTPRPVATPVVVPVEVPLEFYFNCPISRGSFELELDGEPLAQESFDFSTRGFLGVRRRGSGVIQKTYTVLKGDYKLTVRLRDHDGELLGQETLEARMAPDVRSIVKIEMDSRRAAPRFVFMALEKRR